MSRAYKNGLGGYTVYAETTLMGIWEDFDEAKATIDRLVEALPCWYCGEPLGKDEPLLLDDAWECHRLCAPLARKQFGMNISTYDPMQRC